MEKLIPNKIYMHFRFDGVHIVRYLGFGREFTCDQMLEKWPESHDPRDIGFRVPFDANARVYDVLAIMPNEDAYEWRTPPFQREISLPGGIGKERPQDQIYLFGLNSDSASKSRCIDSFTPHGERFYNENLTSELKEKIDNIFDSFESKV